MRGSIEQACGWGHAGTFAKSAFLLWIKSCFMLLCILRKGVHFCCKVPRDFAHFRESPLSKTKHYQRDHNEGMPDDRSTRHIR